MGYASIRKSKPELAKPKSTVMPSAEIKAGDTIRPSLRPQLVGSIPLALLLVGALVAIPICHGPYAVAPLALFVLAVVWSLLQTISIIIHQVSAKYIITHNSVAAHLGLISRRVVEVRVADIRGTAFAQGIFGRLLNYGDVAIGTAATGSAEIVMRGVASPAAIVAAINSLRR